MHIYSVFFFAYPTGDNKVGRRFLENKRGGQGKRGVGRGG